MRRRRGHVDQPAQRRDRLAQLADLVGQGEVVPPVVAEVLAVQAAQFAGHDRVIAASQDRRDHLVRLQGEEPFLPDVVRGDGVRPDDQHHAI
jgi:hypothetical protein